MKKLTPYFSAFLVAGLLASLFLHQAFALLLIPPSTDGGGGGGTGSTCSAFAMVANPSAVPAGIPRSVTFSWTQRSPSLVDSGETITNLQTGAVVYSGAYLNPVTATITITTSTMFQLDEFTTSLCETTPIGVIVAATPPVCGNGILEPGEQCDLGISNGTCPSLCSLSCKTNTCSGQFDQGSSTISVLSATPGGPYSIPIVITGRDSLTRIITSTSTLMITATIASPIPPPVITSISPSLAVAGSAAFSLTVAGTNFVSSSVVRWNGANRPTTFIASTQLTASIASIDVSATGTYPVTVFNP